MDNSNQFLGLFFAVITSILIAITFFLYILQKASAPVVPEYIPPVREAQPVEDVPLVEATVDVSTSTSE